jgi:hypothetical protein
VIDDDDAPSAAASNANTVRSAYLVHAPIHIIFDLDLTLIHAIDLSHEERRRLLEEVDAQGVSWKELLEWMDTCEFSIPGEKAMDKTFLVKFRQGVVETVWCKSV